MSFPECASLAEEHRLWSLTTVSKDVPKNDYQHYISLSANVGLGFKHCSLNYLKGIKQPESELTSAKLPLTVSIPDKVALKLMQHRHSASSEIRLPALCSEKIRQDNSGFVCLAAARPLRIVQNGENQNQNSGAELDKPVVLLLSPIPVFFSPLLFLGFTLSQVNVWNPPCICQRSSPSGAFLPVSSASLKRSLALNYWERPQPLLCQGDGLVNEWQNEMHTLPSCCSHTTSHLWAGHTYTSADEHDTWPLLYAQTHVWAGPGTGQIRTRWLQHWSALILHTKQLTKCFIKGIVQSRFFKFKQDWSDVRVKNWWYLMILNFQNEKPALFIISRTYYFNLISYFNLNSPIQKLFSCFWNCLQPACIYMIKIL